MAKKFDASKLSPEDQAAYTAWQQKAQSLIGSSTAGSPNSVNGLPAELSYVLVHPEYLKTHPELQEAYDTMKGINLPPSVKSAITQQLGGNTNFDWSGGQAGVAKHGGWWSQPESWVQLGLGAAIGGAGAAGAFGGAGGSAASGASGAGAAGGGTAATVGGSTAAAGGIPTAIGAGGNLGTGALATLPGYTTNAAVLGGGAGGAGGYLGTIKKILGAAGPVGEVAGKAAAAGAQGNLDEGELLRKMYESQLLNAQQQHTAGTSDAELQMKQLDNAAKVKRNAQAQALWGGILQGMGDSSIEVPAHIKSHMATINPGLTPSMIVGKNALGQQVQQSAQETLDKPPTYQTPAPYAPPTVPTLPSGGKGQSFLSYLGLLGSLGGATQNYVPGVKKTQNQP